MTLAQPNEMTLAVEFAEITMPVDFSALGWQVLPLAESLAESFGVDLRFVHVVDPDSSWRFEEPDQRILTAAPHGRHIKVGVITGAEDPVEGIMAYLAHRDRALLTMATHARTPRPPEAATGSILEEVVGRSRGPVVAVGPNFDAGTHSKVRRLVACVSNSRDALLIVPDALAWARALDVPLEIVTVSSGLPAWSADDDDVVERTVKTITPAYSAVTGVTLAGSRRPGDEIVRYAAVVPGTMLALSTHAGSHMPRAVGSVAAHVTRETPTGIVFLRPYQNEKHTSAS